jgi:osmotically-inducible protein OsmY
MRIRRWIATVALGLAVAAPSATFAQEASAKDKAQAKTEKTAAKTKKAAHKTAAKSDKATDKAASKSESAGEAITDAWITTKVKADFINESTLKGSDINVDTNNHVVTLKGTVASLAGKTRAGEIAKTTKGVTRVVNELTVAPKK